MCVLLLGAGLCGAEDVTVTARVALANEGQHGRHQPSGDVVLWLVPAGGVTPATPSSDPPRPQLVQRNKMFEPHLLVVPVGSVVKFPNRDPFFHNVFSLFEGKRFDLGLYEAGGSRDVVFDKPGISYIFCDIHAQMSAVIIALPTSYFAISDRKGEVIIPHVPAGRYTLHLWYEAALPEQLNRLTREVAVSESASTLGLFRLTAARVAEPHKDKYGRDYDPATPDSPAYPRP
jgi:plastocyanin